MKELTDGEKQVVRIVSLKVDALINEHLKHFHRDTALAISNSIVLNMAGSIILHTCEFPAGKTQADITPHDYLNLVVGRSVEFYADLTERIKALIRKL